MHETERPPSVIGTALKFGVGAALAGLVCCVAPAILLILGVGSAVTLFSFADFFYAPDGSPNLWGWLLRGVGLLIAIWGIWLFTRRQQACSIDTKRRKLNTGLVALLIFTIFGLGLVALDVASNYVFEEIGIAKQQREYFDQHVARFQLALEAQDGAAAQEHLGAARQQLADAEAYLSAETLAAWRQELDSLAGKLPME